MKKVCLLLALIAAASSAWAGEIGADGFYQLDSLELSGFNGAVAGTSTLTLNGLKGTIAGIQGAGNNTWWQQFAPTNRATLPTSMAGATGWKLTVTNTGTVGFNVGLCVGNPTNWWQKGPDTWVNPGQTGTASLTIQGPDDVSNMFIIFAGSGDSDVWTFTFVGVADKSKPWNPSPEDEPAGISAVVLPETVLTWNTSMVKDPNERPNPAIRKHYVFANFADPSDPNLVYVGEVDAGDPVAAAVQYPAVGSTLFLQPLSVYTWQIKEGLDDGAGGVYPYSDPNGLIEGPVWTFKTASNEPIILSAPKYTTVAPSDTAVLTAHFFSLSAISQYGWLWSGDNGATVVPLTNGPHPSGSGSTVAISLSETAPKNIVLTITNAQGGDDGWYSCTLTNAAGPVQSENLGLAVKRLVAYYPFDGSLADVSGEGNDGTARNADPAAIDLGYDLGVSGQAVVLNAVTASSDPNKTYIELPMAGYPKPAPGGAMEAGTLLFWYKSYGQGRLMGSANNSPDTTAFTVRVDTNFDVYINGASNISNNPSLHVTLADNTWRFGAIRWQLGGENRIYAGYLNQNGISSAVMEAAPMTTFSDFDHPMIIGAENWRGTIGSYLNNATIDELKIYNYALTDAEIADIFNAVSGRGLCATAYQNQFDFDGDCIVGLGDIAELAGAWLSCGVLPDSACGN